MDSILEKFKSSFIDEANSLLDKLEKDLLELEKETDNKPLIESAFRAMHTIKGVSSMYGYEYINDYTHHMENIYQNIREGKLSFNKEIFTVSFASIDHIRKLLADEQLSNETLRNNHIALLEQIRIASGDISKKETATNSEITSNDQIKSTATWHIILKANEKLYFRGINILSIFNELAKIGEFNISKSEGPENENIDIWDIFIKAEATEDDLREVFMFIEDDCTFLKLSDTEEPRTENAKEKKESLISYASNIKIHHDEESLKKDSSAKILQHENKSVNRISVDSAKLDHLMYLVSELITVNSQLFTSTHSQMFNVIRPQLEKVDSLSKQFRNNALDIRLVPLGEVVLKFQRLIRDLSKALNKKIEFVTQGIETELDKNTIDRISEPMMHIIRNCIDHGIELPEQRIKKGKPETGIIKLSAYQSGFNVFIKIEDDGTGINLEKVRQKAVDLNIFKPTDKPTKQEIFDLIFLPGFSTAQSLTEVSGRGVGMDVVKKNITDLRGDVIVDSQEGVGTSFTLKLQQSLAILDTLLFSVDSTHFIVPLADIEICIQSDISDIEKKRNIGTIPFNNEMIPFVDLRTLFNLEGKYDEKPKTVIIHSNDKFIALLTDKIIGEHQAVLKPLGKSFSDQHYVTSASQLGDGNLAFMIDCKTLFSEVSSYSNSK